MRNIATFALAADAAPVSAPPSDLSVVATRLMEAASLARDGNCEAAKAQVARAVALLRGEPSSIPESPRPRGSGAPDVVRGQLMTWKKRRLTAYIDAHLSDPIRVSELAALVDLSESHFSRAFRSTFGISAHEYVTRRRIEVAQSLMLGSPEPLSAIASRCGLSDQSHFSRLFRRIAGETPCAWRRARLEQIEDWPTERSNSTTLRHSVSVR